ncbi:MAG: (Fe-S)-binding protein [Betaproteobacteria bacterium]|nr:(Fe-S)-binding protein [Betaproteobacteria bacterium]
MDHALVPAREVFRHFPALLVVAFYLISVVAVGVFAYGLWLRIRKYCAGRPANRFDLMWRRILGAAWTIGGQVTLRKRDSYAGWAHALIFWAFAGLFIGTLIIMVDHDFLRPITPALQFWKGTFYLWNSLILDLMGVGLLVGLGMMATRRWRFGLAQLDYSRPDRNPGEYSRLGYVRDDQVFLWGLFVIGATGFLIEGLRICADRPPFEVWSVVGWQLANGIDALGLSPATASRLHLYIWWLHAVLALAFVAYIPYSKAIHMLVDMANLLFRDELAGKRLPGIADGAAAMGYRGLADFTWKELMDLDACTKCGRCHIACPARAGGWPLSPRDLILDLREHAEATLGGRSWLHETRVRQVHGAVAGGLIKGETLWACTTCLACVEACPVGIEHVPLIVQMRRTLIEEGILDRNLQDVLEKLAHYGNSFGEPGHNRAKWTQGLPFKVTDARTEPVDFLWFVGDYASYDPSLQEITRSVARIFRKAGLRFGILYEAERNSGNDVRRVGEEGLYQLLAGHNVAALARAQFKEIVTTDPHSYNTIKFEYPAFGATYSVRHYTEVIRELLETGRLPVRRRLDAVVTYHDPCYLSRYTEVTDAPRAILQALGLTLIEMGRNRSNSFCCGAGGGRIWMTDAGAAERPSVQRIKEALQIPRVTYFVVGCPKDVTMFRDAVKTTGNEGRLQVKDLIELVEEAIGSDGDSCVADVS